VAGLTPRTLRRLHYPHIPLIETSVRLAGYAEHGDAVLSNSQYVPFFAQIPGRVITKEEAVHGVDLSNVGPPYRFVVLELKSNYFHPEWFGQLNGRYEQLDMVGVDQDEVRTLILRRRARVGHKTHHTDTPERPNCVDIAARTP